MPRGREYVTGRAEPLTFLVDPQPASHWVSLTTTDPRAASTPRGDARWRPFNGPLSPASAKVW